MAMTRMTRDHRIVYLYVRILLEMSQQKGADDPVTVIDQAIADHRRGEPYKGQDEARTIIEGARALAAAIG